MAQIPASESRTTGAVVAAPSTPFFDPPLGTDAERMLHDFLDSNRSVILRKTEGLREADFHRTTAASTLTLARLLTHLAWVEDFWFRVRFLGLAPASPWDEADFESDEDWEFSLADRIPAAEARAHYIAAVERSREVVAEAADLDVRCAAQASGRVPVVPGHEGGTWTLRYILTHMIEETARHAGHADVLRESIDGAVGD